MVGLRVSQNCIVSAHVARRERQSPLGGFIAFAGVLHRWHRTVEPDCRESGSNRITRFARHEQMRTFNDGALVGWLECHHGSGR